MPENVYVIIGSWIIITLAVERATEIISDSKFFFPLRNLLAVCALSDRPRTLPKLCAIFLHLVISCAWCLSVWVSLFFCWFLPGKYFLLAAAHNILVKWLALVGAANLWHAVFRLVFRGRVITVDIKHTVVMAGESTEDGELTELGIVMGEDDDGEYSEGDE